MSKIRKKLLENKKEIGFCSCVIKVKEKKEIEENKDINGNKAKVWLEHFNDIISEDIKNMMNNKNRLKLHKSLNLINNLQLCNNRVGGKNINVLLNNPFGFDLNKIVNEKIKEKENQNNNNNNFDDDKVNNSTELSRNNTKVSYDDYIWNNEMKRYMSLKESQSVYQFNGTNSKRNKTCFDVSNSNHHNRSMNDKMKILKSENLYINNNDDNNRYNISLRNVDVHNNLSISKKKEESTIFNNNNNDDDDDEHTKKETYLKISSNKKNNNKITYDFNHINQRNNYNYHDLYINEKEKKDRLNNEIFNESYDIKYKTIQQNYNNILIIQDKNNKKAKIVANKKVEVGQILFIEHELLETAILFDDLWETFNMLNEDQKKQIDYIIHLKYYKNEYDNVPNINNNEPVIKEDGYLKEKKNIPHRNDNNTYNDHHNKNNMTNQNSMVFKEFTNSNSNNNNNNNIYKESINNFRNDRFIDKLIQFEKFTDILKNSFISSSNKSKIKLFKHASFLNHSCFPNASYCFIDDKNICLLAMRTINMYDEITISLINELYTSIQYRNEKLNKIKNITCSCNRCLQIIDEERNILCAACKYSYVSKKINQNYMPTIMYQQKNFKQKDDKNENDMENQSHNNNLLKYNTLNGEEKNSINTTNYKNKEIFDENNLYKYSNTTNYNETHIKEYEYNNISKSNLGKNNIVSEKIQGNITYPSDIAYTNLLNNSEDSKIHNADNINKSQKLLFGMKYKEISQNKLDHAKRLDEISVEHHLPRNNKSLHNICNNNTFCLANENVYDFDRSKTELIIKNNIKKRTNKKDNIEDPNMFNSEDALLSSTSLYNNKYNNDKNNRNNKYNNIKNYGCNNNNMGIEQTRCLTNNNINLNVLYNSHLPFSIKLKNNFLHILNVKNAEDEKIGYCKFVNNEEWICAICNNSISKYVMPLKSEYYFIIQYNAIKEKINTNNFELSILISNIEETLSYIISILGEKHWLYASFNYIIADICFSLYTMNSLNENYISTCFNAFYNFFYFIQIQCPQAIHTDLVPLVLKFFIICIYTGNYNTIYNLATSGFLELIKQKYGSWDVSYICLQRAFKMCYEHMHNRKIMDRTTILTLADMANNNILNMVH